MNLRKLIVKEEEIGTKRNCLIFPLKTMENEHYVCARDPPPSLFSFHCLSRGGDGVGLLSCLIGTWYFGVPEHTQIF